MCHSAVIGSEKVESSLLVCSPGATDQMTAKDEAEIIETKHSDGVGRLVGKPKFRSTRLHEDACEREECTCCS